MATFFKLLVASANNTGSFRAWVSASEDAFNRFGWINTNASGTINWQTVNPPNGAAQTRGYSVWQFNDSFQSTAPVFIKIEYGSSDNANRFRYGISVGQYHNGSGTLFSSSSRLLVQTPNDDFTTSMSFAYSGDAGRGIIVQGFNYAGTALSTCVWGIERGRDLQGNITPDSLFVYSLGPNTTFTLGLALYSYATSSTRFTEILPSSVGWIPFFFVDDTFTNNLNGETLVRMDSAPAAFLNYNIRGYGLPIGVMAVKRNTADTGSGDLITVYPYGRQTTYLNLGNTFATQQLSINEFVLFVQWE